MAGSKDDKSPTRLNDMIAGRPNKLVGQTPGRKRRTESGEEDVETGEEEDVAVEAEQVRANGLYVNASPFAAFADKNRASQPPRGGPSAQGFADPHSVRTGDRSIGLGPAPANGDVQTTATPDIDADRDDD